MAAPITVKLKGMDTVVRNLKQFPEISEPIYQRAVMAAEAVMGKYSTRDLIPWRTGNLLHSFRFETGRLWAKWYPTAPYAGVVNDGRGPYTIDNAFGRGIKVRHPGFAGRHYMEAISSRSEKDIQKLFDEATGMVAEALTK